MKKDFKTLKNNTIMLYILQISKYVFPLLTFPYLTRVLQPEYYGIMVFANGVMVYFQLLLDFGFLLSSTKSCSLYRADKRKLEEIIASTVQAKVVLALIGLAILIPLLYFVDLFQGRETYIILSYIPVVMGIFNLDYLFRGLEKMEIITYRTIVGRLIYTVLVFLFIQEPEHYLFIPIIAAFGEMVILIWVWYYTRKFIGLRMKFVSVSKTILSLKLSAIFFLSRIASTAYSSTNILVLGLIYNNAAIAQFGVASVLIDNLKSLFSPIADSLYPYMIHKKNYKLIKKILLVLMPIIILGTVILYFLAEPIIIFMSGKDYLDSIPIFRAFLPIIIITLPVYLLGFPVLGALNRMKDANLSVIIAAFYHVFGLVFLYYSENLTFITVALLTCSTELLVLLYRMYSTRNGIRQLKASS